MNGRSDPALPGLFRDRRLNAALAWIAAALTFGVVVAELTLGDLVSAVFGVGVLLVVLVVPLAYRSVRTMLPWELVVLASLPTVGRAILPATLAGSVATYTPRHIWVKTITNCSGPTRRFYPRIDTHDLIKMCLGVYLAVATVALIVAVELHAFTSVSMTYEFALLYVVMTTLAAAGTWAVVRWVIDVQFGTGFIADNEALIVEFV